MELLNKLTAAFGPSGYEDEVANIIIDEIKPYVDEIKRDRLGNIIALKKGKTSKKIMTSAHMDQIGVMVSYIEKEGYLRFTNVGWVDPYAILYHIVRFKNGVTGIVSKEDKKEIKDLKLKDLYIDIGACSKEEAESKVRIGDFAVFESFFKSVGDRVYSGALDDRIGCYILIEAAKRLKDNKSDVYFTFTVQEETYTSGAATSAFAIEPDMAVVIDVTDTGDTPNCNAMAVKMGDGAAIKVKDGGMICHPFIKKFLEETAEKYGIKHQYEILVGGATDGSEIHVSKAGVLTGAISIPSRYVHTPEELVDMKDVEAVISLLTKTLEEWEK